MPKLSCGTNVLSGVATGVAMLDQGPGTAAYASQAKVAIDRAFAAAQAAADLAASQNQCPGSCGFGIPWTTVGDTMSLKATSVKIPNPIHKPNLPEYIVIWTITASCGWKVSIDCQDVASVIKSHVKLR